MLLGLGRCVAMPNLTAAEQAIVSRSGGSSRLLAHRLETYDADEAKNVGSAFESAWRARHGNGVGQQASALPLASPAKVSPPPKPAASAVPANTPTPPSKGPEVTAEARAAAERKQAIIAQAALDFEANRKAEESKLQRQAAADGVWARAYGLPPEIEQPASPKPMDEAARRRAASDAVWDRANSRVAASRGEVRPAASAAPAVDPAPQTAAQKQATGDAVWDRVNAKREALRAHL